MISNNRRHAVFNEIQRLVADYDDAVARHDSDDFWSVDDALSNIIIRLNGETRRIRKIKQAPEASVCSAA